MSPRATDQGSISLKVDGLSAEASKKAMSSLAILIGGGVYAEPLAMSGGEVIIVVVAIAAIAWMLCITAGSFQCLSAAAAQCGEGNVKTAEANCGASASDEGWMPSLGFGCTIECQPPTDPGPPEIPPGFPPALPGPGVYVPIPTETGFGGCPNEMRPDICIVGYSEHVSYDTSGEIEEVTVESSPITEPCCVPY